MAWDDAPPTTDELKGPAKGASWDATPPTKDELPSWSDLPGNIIPDAANMLKGSAETAGRIAKGVFDLPSDLAETAKEELTGGSPLDTPIAQDVKTVGQGVWDAAKAIPKSLTDLGNKEAWIKHPVGNALTGAAVVAPFLGGEEAASEAAAKGVGEAKPIPETPPIEPEAPKVVPMGGEELKSEPASRMPPDPNAPPPAEPPPVAPKADPLQEVKDYVNSKYEKISSKEGLPTKLAKMLDEESANLGAKDLGLQSRQIETMGPGFIGTDKAKALVNYAREKGYFDPTLSDVARKEKITSTMKSAGNNVDAIRTLADKRGAPPVDDIKAAVKQELEAKYGAGTEKATSEIANVMEDIEKAPKTFTGMSELATKLNKSATPVKKLGQHPGPTTDAANIVSRLNNDAIRGTLNAKESDLYTQSLRDYGAHKKLEQAVASAERRKMGARSNQRGILGRLYQETLDRGGYRLGGNIASKTAKSILKSPGKVNTLPQFFEELAHQSNEAVDEAIQGMSKGGLVPDDVRRYVGSKC